MVSGCQDRRGRINIMRTLDNGTLYANGLSPSPEPTSNVENFNHSYDHILLSESFKMEFLQAFILQSPFYKVLAKDSLRVTPEERVVTKDSFRNTRD